MNALVKRLFATVDVNVTYARMLRELLPMPKSATNTVITKLNEDLKNQAIKE